MNKAQRLFYTSRALGWGNLPRRAWQIAKSRLGIVRRQLPGGELSDDALRGQFISEYDPEKSTDLWKHRAAGFFVESRSSTAIGASLRSIVDEPEWDTSVACIGRQLRAGSMQFFGRLHSKVGYPPNFNYNPIHGVVWPVGRHWSEYPQFDPNLKDLKCVWESSRFTWAYALARDFVRRRDESTAGLFWELFDEWDKQNPYGLTPAWACGQESTFRMFAWVFAAMATMDSEAATAARLRRVTELVWYTGRHIECNINYARGQKNNHALSEAAGLLTIGLLFPELRKAPAWRAKGRNVLETDLGRQIYPDGSYVQHSLNYHRVMLDDLLWAARLADLHGEPLSSETLATLDRALEWLLQMIDPESGGAPNYGPNDGAQVLPLSTCDYADFRPVAQAAHYLLKGERCFPAGPWDEKLLWLFGPDALQSRVRRFARQVAFRGDSGGYYTFKGLRTWGMVRCHTYRDRPSQADMLHFDLWDGAHNLFRDAGTYHYYCDQPWQDYFYSTAAHNTVEVDGADQMIKGPRFLWFRWTRSRLKAFDSGADGRLTFFEGEHYGYARLPGKIVHRRSILRIDDSYVIIDDLLGAGKHDVGLRWRLCEADWRNDGGRWCARIDERGFCVAVIASDAFATELVRGRTSPSPEGWESRYYAEKTPTPLILVQGRSTLPVRLVTLASPESNAVQITISDAGTPDAAVVLSGIDAGLTSHVENIARGRVRVAPFN